MGGWLAAPLDDDSFLWTKSSFNQFKPKWVKNLLPLLLMLFPWKQKTRYLLIPSVNFAKLKNAPQIQGVTKAKHLRQTFKWSQQYHQPTFCLFEKTILPIQLNTKKQNKKPYGHTYVCPCVYSPTKQRITVYVLFSCVIYEIRRIPLLTSFVL